MKNWLKFFKKCLIEYWKTLAINFLCIILLIVYALVGAIVFLHFEVPFSREFNLINLQEKSECIIHHLKYNNNNFSFINNFKNSTELFLIFLDNEQQKFKTADTLQNQTTKITTQTKLNFSNIKKERLHQFYLAQEIFENCVTTFENLDERNVWNLKNGFLFSFGIITTLGYGKIEPETENGRIFTVFYGFIGVPFTVILLTNFMQFLLNSEQRIRKHFYYKNYHKRSNDEHQRSWRSLDSLYLGDSINDNNTDSISTKTSLKKLKNYYKYNNSNNNNNDLINFQHKNSFKMFKKASLRLNLLKNKKKKKTSEVGSITAGTILPEEFGQISMCTLIGIVLIYMLFGGILMSLIAITSLPSSNLFFKNFLDGIYYAFIILIHIEYGNFVPQNALWLPIVMSYVCFGLSISAISMRVGSGYVKHLYYFGHKIRNIANVKIRFGNKNLQVKDLLSALGNNIGLDETILSDLDLEKLVANAINVKEGRMERVPQTCVIADGIWPPELVPLFIKDGGDFPVYVDAEEERRNIWSSFRNSMRQKTSEGNSVLPLPQILLRQRLMWMCRNKKFKIKKQNQLEFYINEEKSDLSSTESLPPESEKSSPTHLYRAPPPFLFQKPSIRFYDIIYNNLTTFRQQQKQEYRRYNYNRYYQHHQYCKKNSKESECLSDLNNNENPLATKQEELTSN